MTGAEVLIAGGGFAGLATAAACAAQGMNVCVLEALARPTPAFRGELLHPPGTELLSKIDLGNELCQAGGVTIDGFAVFESRDTAPVLLPYPDPAARGAAVSHREMLARFRDRLKREQRVELHQGTPVVGLVCEKQRVIGLEALDGRKFHGGAIVVADGRHSRLRSLLGIRAKSSLLSYTVALDLQGTCLPERQCGHVFVGAPGPVLAYHYRSRDVRLCVDVPLGAPRGRAALSLYVENDYTPHLPHGLRAAALDALERGTFELCANHAIYTDACTVPGAALVGDAAGCSHPLTATGMPVTLRDAVTLAECLATGVSSDAQLLMYQRRHYRFARGRELFAQALYDVFRRGDPGARALCDGIFHYWRRDQRARAASIRILSGETPSSLALANQYARVFGVASAETLKRALRAGKPRAATAIGPMFSVAGSSLRLAFAQACAALRTELALPLNS
jgi:2-polyprenyl-6-methoxyphenol hydroxylase-like FAD-dependent oxidoreductase